MSKAVRIKKFPIKIFNIKNADAKVVILNDKEVMVEFRIGKVFAGGCKIKSQVFGNVLVELIHEDLNNDSKNLSKDV